MLAPLKSTKFGIAYDKEPKLLKGVYKYKAGTNYIDGSVKPAQEGLNIIDECSIAAVLYEDVYKRQIQDSGRGEGRL